MSLIEEFVAGNETERVKIAKNPNISDDLLTQALNDVSWKVRLSALRNPNVRDDQLMNASNDKNASVRCLASEILRERSTYVHPSEEQL